MDRYARAEALVRTTRSLAGAALRASYVASVAREWDVELLARVLDIVCERAEQAEASAREVLLAIVDALNAQGMDEIVQRLREQAVGESLLALERVVRAPDGAAAHFSRRGPQLAAARDPATTLGQRKYLARRPDREIMQRLMADPHPDVIRSLLRNPRITEDDVVRLAAKRPGRGEVLAEIARSTRWSHGPRVRIALVVNPGTPPEIAARIAGLLLRPELDLVARLPGVAPSVRAVCLEHLERRPPVEGAKQRGQPLH
ncbi:MAG TPA: hypothetical protein VN894_00980 [Polyangiaceae bacterium]|nr:hypothetical protein [Polyangiaceae bacterium]